MAVGTATVVPRETVAQSRLFHVVVTAMERIETSREAEMVKRHNPRVS